MTNKSTIVNRKTEMWTSDEYQSLYTLIWNFANKEYLQYLKKS